MFLHQMMQVRIIFHSCHGRSVKAGRHLRAIDDCCPQGSHEQGAVVQLKEIQEKLKLFQHSFKPVKIQLPASDCPQTPSTAAQRCDFLKDE